MGYSASGPAGPLNTADDVQGIRITDIGSIDRLSWDVIVLVGKGRVADARAHLARTNQGGGATYLLGMGLARLDGNREEFDRMSYEYSTETGQNPPGWAVKDALSLTGGPREGTAILVESFDADEYVRTAIELESPNSVVLDFGPLPPEGVLDADGIELLLDSIGMRRESGFVTRVANAENLVARLHENVRAAADADTRIWRLLIALLNLSDRREDFDRACAAFSQRGGAPQTWMEVAEEPAPGDADASAGEAAASAQPSVPAHSTLAAPVRLSELDSKFAEQVLESVAGAPKGTEPMVVEIDFIGMREFDVLDGPTSLAFVRAARARDDVQLRFTNVNEVLAALFRAMGVDKHASLTSSGVKK